MPSSWSPNKGTAATEVGRRLGIHHSQTFHDGSEIIAEVLENFNGYPRGLEAEVKRLRKENKRLQMERDILKKAAAFFANESK